MPDQNNLLIFCIGSQKTNFDKGIPNNNNIYLLTSNMNPGLKSAVIPTIKNNTLYISKIPYMYMYMYLCMMYMYYVHDHHSHAIIIRSNLY